MTGGEKVTSPSRSKAQLFAGVGRVQRQRMVNLALADLLVKRVHALAIKARAPANDRDLVPAKARISVSPDTALFTGRDASRRWHDEDRP
jgi:hypothetical protein